MASTMAEEVTPSFTYEWFLLVVRFATKIPGSNLKKVELSGSCLYVRIICLRCDGKSKGASWLYMYCAYVRNTFIVKSWWMQLWSDAKMHFPRILKRIVPDAGKENGTTWFARMQAKTNVVSRGQQTTLVLAFATFCNTGRTGCAVGSWYLYIKRVKLSDLNLIPFGMIVISLGHF